MSKSAYPVSPRMPAPALIPIQLVELFEDLLGDWVLVCHRHWTGANRPGNQKMAFMANHADALHQLKSIEALRRKRAIDV